VVGGGEYQRQRRLSGMRDAARSGRECAGAGRRGSPSLTDDHASLLEKRCRLLLQVAAQALVLHMGYGQVWARSSGLGLGETLGISPDSCCWRRVRRPAVCRCRPSLLQSRTSNKQARCCICPHLCALLHGHEVHAAEAGAHFGAQAGGPCLSVVVVGTF